MASDCGGEVHGRDLLVLGLDHLVHGLLDIGRRLDLLELCPDDLDPPRLGLGLEHLAELVVDPAPFAVGGLQGQSPDDVPERGPGKVDDLVLVVVDIVLGGLHVLLVGFDLEVDLGVHRRVEIVGGDDLLAGGIHHLLGDIDGIQLLDAREDPEESRTGKPLVLPQEFDQHPVRRSDDPDAEEEVTDNDRGDDRIDDVLGS
jgi:hypothetical protein